jgi:hypothetical protein
MRGLPEPMMTVPDKLGAAGRAWRIDLAALSTALAIPIENSSLVASWIIEAPWAHPLWHSYNLTLVHLRPMEGVGEPIVYRQGATHELLLFALDPEAPREPMLRSARPRWLYPANFAAQLVEASDAAASARVEATVDLVVAGELNPDTDFRRQWIALFGDDMVRSDYRR